jgi:hypothetical protein
MAWRCCPLLSLAESAYSSHRISKGPPEKIFRTGMPWNKDKERLLSTYPF